jgi:hypothetical protein
MDSRLLQGDAQPGLRATWALPARPRRFQAARLYDYDAGRGLQ